MMIKRYDRLAAACAICILLMLLGCGGGGIDSSSDGIDSGNGGPDAITPQADWHAAPDGLSGSAGTADDPLDLATLLALGSPVAPGQRVELQAGIYRGRFTCRVAGSAGAPIIFAAAPDARVTLDGNAPTTGMSNDSVLTIDQNCRWVEFHGLEITHSITDRNAMVDGVEIYGANTKLVNAVIHNTSQGIGFWRPAENSTLYGNIIYNNGYEGPSRGHGHAIYTQNQHGTKHIANNILFFGYGFGIHAYTEGGYLQGFDILNNVWFRTGASRPGSSRDGTSDGCLVGGLQPVARTRLEGNHSWAPRVSGRSLRLGYGGGVQNMDIALIDNYLVGQVNVQGDWNSEICTVNNNAFHSSTNGIDPDHFRNNTYTSQLPSASRTVIQTNDYDATRADLIIYNWDDHPSVPVDLSALLSPGAVYRIYSVFDLWGEPVISGVYNGSDIHIPMGTKAPPQPQGEASPSIIGDDDPGETFGVFILRSNRPLGAS